MGITLTIAIQSETEQISDLYKTTLERVSKKSQIVKISTQAWEDFAKGIEKTYSPDIKELSSLIDKIPFSSMRLRIELSYLLPSNRIIYPDLYLYGCKYRNGLETKEDSAIQMLIRLSSMEETISNLLEDHYYSFMPKEEILKNFVYQQTIHKINKDWEDLFFRICGLYDLDYVPVEHAAVYMEAGWPAPSCCAMLFHRNKQEFAKDFLRIYRDYHWKNQFMSEMLSKNFDLEAGLQGYFTIENIQERKSYYAQFDDTVGKLTDFLEQIDEKKIRKLARFSEREIDAALSLAGDWLSEHTIECSTQYFDFGEKGGAVLSTPKTSIWRLYEYIYQLV